MAETALRFIAPGVDAMLDRLDETIVAVSSAPGCAPLGIVRLSGDDAIAIADRLAHTGTGRPLSALPGSTRVSGTVRLEPQSSIPADFYLFRAPHSSTRQNLVEIHTVGSPAVLEAIRVRAIELGALAAQPGEFTARAFLNGAMNLAGAEAVAGLIQAHSDTQLRAAHRMRDGALARRIEAVCDELGELLARVEADIDFAEEPIEFVTPTALRERLQTITDGLETLQRSAASVERFDALPQILLFGPPNGGKSSLMNRLSGTSRSICAAAAGTTRDILSAPIRVGRGEAILLDTAGVDRSDDEIIAQARAMTLSQAQRVDLICLVVDLSRPDDDHAFESAGSLDVDRVVVAANKCDLLTPDQTAASVERLKRRRLGPVCVISAKTGAGVEELRAALANALADRMATTMGEAMLLSERQRSAIAEAVESLKRASQLGETAVETIDCADVLAFELREALDLLGEVTGEVTTEDLLARVFAKFCIGK